MWQKIDNKVLTYHSCMLLMAKFTKYIDEAVIEQVLLKVSNWMMKDSSSNLQSRKSSIASEGIIDL